LISFALSGRKGSKFGSAIVLNLNYSSYDNAHNILTQVKNGVTKAFSYDNVNQLLGVNVSGIQKEQFSYDPVGNRLSSIDNSPWSYNTDNELMGYGVTSMTYDANGNMTSDSSSGSTLTYDFENRLASFVTSSVTASYLYDPQGRRLQKTVNSVVTRYLWDGATMIAELDGTNQIQRLYTYNPQTMEPVSTAIGCTAYFSITDHLMTPQMMTSIFGTAE
jgi:YD repeat-containing protein